MSAIDPDELLLAYRLGIFPMAESRHAPGVLWIRPRQRGIIPLQEFHVPKRLARVIRAGRYQVRVDTAFGAVIRGCAETSPGRDETWINRAIVEVFEALHARGLAHSVEAWAEGELAGGLYGLSLGGAFFAESKYSRRTDAGKVALVHLAARLKRGGYSLLDAQFPNPHLSQFGAVTIGERRFERLLAKALAQRGEFYSFEGAASGMPSGSGRPAGADASGASVLQVIGHTS